LGLDAGAAPGDFEFDLVKIGYDVLAWANTKRSARFQVWKYIRSPMVLVAHVKAVSGDLSTRQTQVPLIPLSFTVKD